MPPTDVDASTCPIGTRVVFVKPHPWATHSGTVVDVQTTLVGRGAVVELDNGLRAMAFKSHEIRRLT